MAAPKKSTKKRKPPPRNRTVPPETQNVGAEESRGLLWDDVDPQGQRAFQGLMNGLGNPAAAAGSRIQTLKRAAKDPTNSDDYREKSDRAAQNLQEFRPHLQKVDMSLQGAADRRTEHFFSGILRSTHENEPSGASWFFDHNAANSRIAETHGLPKDRVITAGAMMSPQNSPSNELAAVEAVGGRMVGNEYNEKDLGRSGSEKNLKKADAHLRGGPDTITPLNNPKVNAYRNATSMSIPGGEIQREFDDRVAHAVTYAMDQPHQKSLDLWGLQQSGEGILASDSSSLPTREGPLVDSKEGPLNPAQNTPEDTWMNTVTMGQDPNIRTSGGAALSKFAGSDKLGWVSKKTYRGVSAHPSGSVKATALQHAWNNRATVMSAADVGRRVGSVDSQGESNFPSLALHPVVWTEARRRAGKDAEYNASRAEARKNPQPRSVDIIPKRESQGNPQQTELF
jgi:hypothetical protein